MEKGDEFLAEFADISGTQVEYRASDMFLCFCFGFCLNLTLYKYSK